MVGQTDAMGAGSVGQMVGSLTTTGMGLMHDCQLDYYGKRVAAAASNNTVAVWDITDGQQRPVGQLSGHEGPIWKVSWAHPKFGSLLATCSYDMKVMIWKEAPMNSGNWHIAYVDSSHGASVNDVQFAPWEFGLRLACASSDGTVSVLTYGADGQWHRSAFQAHAGGAQTVSWMPGAQPRDAMGPPTMRLVSGGCDNDVRVFKCDNETWAPEMPPLPASHSDWVRSVAWRPVNDSGNVVASGGWDKTVCIFHQEIEGQPWRQKAQLTLDGKVESCAWSVTGSLLAVAFGEQGETAIFKEVDGQYHKLADVAEAGYKEVPEAAALVSAAAAAAPPAAAVAAPPAGVDLAAFGLAPAPAAAAAPAPAANPEQLEQQQNVLAAFGM